MTNSNDRLERIEQTLERVAERYESIAKRDEITAIRLERLSLQQEEYSRQINQIRAIAESNSRTIQGILENSESKRLQREEEKDHHEQRMARLEEIQADVARAQLGLTRLLASLDEDRPTVLRKLTAIENKVDRLLNRTSE